MGHFTVPAWPRPAPNALRNLQAVLESGRWSLPGPWQGHASAEARFAAHFADFLGAPHCVPTTNGSSALVVAMEALDVGVGDEVIVPGLTWVANASTVLAVNATPVMVDIDPSTLCASPTAIEAAVTERTRAIVVVHLFSSVVDLDAVLAIGERHGIPVIEDCSHAHGASWRGRRVGTWGTVGTFSMQEKKLLTSGEGGAVVCRDPDLADRMFQLRSDGRRLAARPVEGESELVADCSVAGTNYCMSELCAAVLDAQLEALPEQNLRRAENAATVDKLLQELPGLAPVRALPSVTERTYYQYAVRIDREAFGGVTAETVSRALAAETGLPFQTPYPPMYRHPLHRPRTKRRFLLVGRDPSRLDGPAGGLPETERAHREVLTLHHSVLLAPAGAFETLPAAIEKLQQQAGSLRAVESAR
ncbi:DegT/DnrJ/EryC1/StrS family aminotransferase [Streptomyces sp. NPDC005492]|uniref:DegT/DnrJ/EryC1/StrS family aminotransferase n=1 Tax=Streptomyces sp. NPDC005492 TaxID=3156883 RepID=UPI0033A495C5